MFMCSRLKLVMMLGWINYKGKSTARRNINNLKSADDISLMAESEEELKSLLKLKVETEKAGLKYNIHKLILWHLVPSFLEKAMAPHSSTLAWKILCMVEPGRLQSMGSRRVGHD